jgi:hypothetical protein
MDRGFEKVPGERSVTTLTKAWGFKKVGRQVLGVKKDGLV